MRNAYLPKNKTQVARSNTIRDINRQIVLGYIRDKGIVSRADLAKLTDLQRSTVSQIVEDLIKIEFIEEIGEGVSSGGRKPTMLQLQKGRIDAIGIDITPTVTTIGTADLAGNILEKNTFLTDPEVEKTYAEIVFQVNKLIKENDLRFVEIGVSLPGLVDDLTGKVYYVPHFGWKEWFLKDDLQKATGLSVTIDNDANSVALAELWFGSPEVRQLKNFLTILVAEGIGTGMILNGEIYRGKNGVAGEFGHMIVGLEGLVECSCGSRRCWEALASDKATMARFTEISGKKLKIEDIIERAKINNEPEVSVIKETIAYLGIGISNLLVGLSPELVIVNGKIAKLLSPLAQELPQIISRSVRQSLPPIKIIASTLGDNPTLMGALSLALARKYASVG